MSESTLYFTKREIDIINTDAPEIVVKIRSGEWTAEVVTEAFIKTPLQCTSQFCDSCLYFAMFY